MRGDFDKDWPHGHVTIDGRPARIICTDAIGNYPIIALVTDRNGREILHSYMEDGRSFIGDERSFDLINAPAPKRVQEYWVNAYPDGLWTYHPSKALADQSAGTCLFARKRVVITEGEFDD